MLRITHLAALVLIVGALLPAELKLAAVAGPARLSIGPAAVPSPIVVATPVTSGGSTNSGVPRGAPDTRTMEGVNLLNAVRTRAGLAAVGLDSYLSVAPQAHADYLVRNRGKPQIAGLNAHTEDLSLPLASEAGRDAGQRSDIATGVPSVFSAVQGLLGAPLHMVSLLEPNLQAVGVGASWSGTDFDVVIDVGYAIVGHAQTKEPVVYPLADQKDVVVAFTGEIPNPLQATPGGPTARTGPAISINPTCGTLDAPTAVRLSSESGQEIPVWVVNPGTRVVAVGGERVVSQALIFPQHVLDPGSIYRVEVTIRCRPAIPNSTPSLGHQLSWSFTTGDIGH